MTSVQALLKWAWEDPAGRVQQAIGLVSDMASTATGPALAELQDASVMLSRLAGSLDTGPVSDTISEQLAGGTISGQLIELVRDPSWLHEKRGPHGQWVSGGGVSKTRADRIRRIQAAQRARAAAPAERENKASAVIADVEGRPQLSPQLIHEQIQPMVEERAQAIVEAKLAEAQQVVDAKLAEAEKQLKTEEGHKARMRLIIEAGAAVAGAILAFIEVKMGMPGLAAALTNVTPLLIQPIIEFIKKV